MTSSSAGQTNKNMAIGHTAHSLFIYFF